MNERQKKECAEIKREKNCKRRVMSIAYVGVHFVITKPPSTCIQGYFFHVYSPERGSCLIFFSPFAYGFDCRNAGMNEICTPLSCCTTYVRHGYIHNIQCLLYIHLNTCIINNIDFTKKNEWSICFTNSLRCFHLYHLWAALNIYFIHHLGSYRRKIWTSSTMRLSLGNKLFCENLKSDCQHNTF